MCRCSPGDTLVHLRGTGEVFGMFERVTQPAAGAAGEREPSADLAACSSLSRLWVPCAGWRQTLFFHMPLPLPVLKRPGALCSTRPRAGSVTQELATPAVLAGTEGQEHGVWNALYIFQGPLLAVQISFHFLPLLY